MCVLCKHIVCVHVCLCSIYTHMNIIMLDGKGALQIVLRCEMSRQPPSLEELQMVSPAERSDVRTRPATHGKL